MIDKDDLLKQEALYLYRGKVWKIIGYCPGPSVSVECTTSKEQVSFGLGGLMANEFKKIEEEGD